MQATVSDVQLCHVLKKAGKIEHIFNQKLFLGDLSL